MMEGRKGGLEGGGEGRVYGWIEGRWEGGGRQKGWTKEGGREVEIGCRVVSRKEGTIGRRKE